MRAERWAVHIRGHRRSARAGDLARGHSLPLQPLHQLPRARSPLPRRPPSGSPLNSGQPVPGAARSTRCGSTVRARQNCASRLGLARPARPHIVIKNCDGPFCRRAGAVKAGF